MMTPAELRYYTEEIQKAGTPEQIESVLRAVFQIGAESSFE